MFQATATNTSLKGGGTPCASLVHASLLSHRASRVLQGLRHYRVPHAVLPCCAARHCRTPRSPLPYAQKYRVSFEGVTCGSEFYQCVYLLAHKDPGTMAAGAAAREAFGIETRPYMPHLSLLYRWAEYGSGCEGGGGWRVGQYQGRGCRTCGAGMDVDSLTS